MATDFDIPKKYLFCYLVNYNRLILKVICKLYLCGCDRIFRKKALFLTDCEQKRQQQQQFICNELYLFLVKVGTPTNDELEELAYAIMGGWRKLGRRLGVSEAELNSIDRNFKMLWKKGYHMLIHWKRDANASYKVLDDALRHKDIQRQDLAERFCQG